MSEIKLSDHMNLSVKENLKLRGDSLSLYAIARIEYLESNYIPKEEYEKLKNEHLDILNKALKSGFDNLEDAHSKIIWAFEGKSEFQKLKEENQRLTFMVENGLGWKDMENDNKYPTGL